ncbi:MAG: hypothetical protein PF961_10265 [Planctomycetota bacterium]|jgi:hypothetical protein|nr:hypothetical protein [Planctomycetota bacterium]
MSSTAHARSGVLLIIVAGIAAMLVALVTSFFMWMQQDARESQLTVMEAQSRAMLHAGLAYIQEGSLLGWAPTTGDSFATFGWTDVRDGSLGPRGPRAAGASSASNAIANPSWWPGGYLPFPSDSQLPKVTERHWPCPGSSLRGHMAVWERPPSAVQGIQAPNPIRPPQTYRHDDPNWDTPYTSTVSNWQSAYANPADPHFAFGKDSGALGMLDPQPVSDTWAAFRAGDLRTKAGTGDRAWFRIYRELLTDHDGDGLVHPGANVSATKVGWVHDTVALYDPNDPAPDHKNWNVFIITCGAGPTRGYRFWDISDPGFSRATEPVTAAESGIFPDEASFHAMRRAERILFFRVEWTSDLGGTLNPAWTYNKQNLPNDNTLGYNVMSYGGNFKWIQRLDRAPPNW